jgi:muramidase (phage lysozyme)
MTLSSERLQALFDHPNVKAFYAVVRRGESSLGPEAYTMVNGGPPITDFSKHPYEGLSTKQGGRAAGAPQFIPSTWAEIAERYSLPDFSPASQDLGFVGCVLKRTGAIDALLAGRFEEAVRICRPEWTSLPGATENNPAWNMDKARALYLDRGGKLDNEELLQPAAPIEERDTSSIPPVQPKESTMPLPLLALLSFAGPIISDLIPAVAKLFDRKAETPEKLTAAQAVIDTIVKGTSSAGIDEALGKVKADPKLLETVKAQILAEPAVAQYLTVEIGGGVAEARKADVAQQANEKPFYKTSAVFWISMLMLPMVYWYVGSSVVGGVDVPAAWPWYAQIPLKMFGSAWDSGARVGLANLIVGLILGGICGVYYGISVTQNKQSGTPAKEQA